MHSNLPQIMHFPPLPLLLLHQQQPQHQRHRLPLLLLQQLPHQTIHPSRQKRLLSPRQLFLRSTRQRHHHHRRRLPPPHDRHHE
ncbi:hypothetical protein QJS04_geneDACA002760 [Acorus gramineus]|uniref:Uncharacterized protein n=1 Tax=Acorus gramineus TaxID=55184 RepID=A0AAV9BTB0_ACOGR|nr:hypothetical protein QJS04_geneDACA002760 [Acorus gramineus]